MIPNPVFWHNGGVLNGVQAVPGWYFWNHSHTDYHGPYLTQDDAGWALECYCKEILNH